MEDKKERIHVKWDSSIIMSSVWFPLLIFKSGDFRINALADNFHVDEDDDIEDEGDEDEGDAAEDPGGKGGQTNWIGGSRPKSRDEKVYQHLCKCF